MGCAHASATVQIGSWNIQNLGAREWGQEPAELADEIRRSAVDILALQEIHDDDGQDKTRSNGKFDKIIAHLNETDPGWRYELYPRRETDETVRHLGVAWNERRVRKNGEPWRVPVKYDDGRSWRRQPYAVSFQAGEGHTDFVLVPLHMKSNRGGVERAAKVRAGEARALVAQLESIRQHFQDQDLILLGDTNMLESEEAGLRLFGEADFIDLNAADENTYTSVRYGDSPFDRILVPKGQPEFAESRFGVMTPDDPRQHVRRLSDHYLIYTTIRVLADDD